MNRPTTAAQAIDWANATARDNPALHQECEWYSSSCGRIELAIMPDDARSGHHRGACDADIAELMRVPYIAEQLAGIPPDLAREVATEHGRNDYGHGPEDMSDHAANLAFVLWIACGDIIENERE